MNDMGLSKLSEKCKKCHFASKCNCKRMEAMAYMTPESEPVAQPLAAEILVNHDYRNIKVGENTTITIDLEELKKQMREDFYKSVGLGINYGA